MLTTVVRKTQPWRPPTRAEEIRLFESWARHPDDPKIRQQIQEAYERLILKHAIIFSRNCRHLTVDDLFIEGVIVMFASAIPKYDLEMGFRFSTYLTHWLRQAMQRAIDNLENTIRVPVHMGEKGRRVRSSVAWNQKVANREPTVEEIASETGIPVHEVKLLLVTDEPVSLDSLVGDDGTERLEDFRPDKAPQPPERAFLKEYRQLLDELLEHLTARERFILENRYGLDGHGVRTLEQVGHELFITRERIRQIEARAIQKLTRIARKTSIREVV